jgi:hypothetical protein
VKQGARVLGGLEQQDVVVLLRHVIAESAVAGRDEVRVRVDETGQDRRVAVVDALDRRARWRLHRAARAQRDHAVRVHQEGRVDHRRAAAAVEQLRGAEQREAGGGASAGLGVERLRGCAHA